MSSVVLATAGYDHTIRFWEPKSGTNYRTLQYAESQVNRLKVTPDKQYLAAAGNPHIKFFDLTSTHTSAVTDYNGHTANVTSIGFQKEGKWMYSGSEDGTVKVWDLRGPGCQREFKDKHLVNALILHPCQVELIAGYQSGQVKVWDLVSSTCTQDFAPEIGVPVRCAAASADGQLVFFGTNSGLVQVYSWPAFTKVAEFQAHKTHVLQIVVAPDQRMLATTSSDHTIRLWAMNTWALQKTLAGHTRWVWDCQFSNDSAYLVSASSDMYAKLWDVASAQTVVTYKGHQKAITCITLADSV